MYAAGRHPREAPALLRRVYSRRTQALAVPAILSGRNVVLAAETGSGKTIAYLAPVMSRLLAARALVPAQEPGGSGRHR